MCIWRAKYITLTVFFISLQGDRGNNGSVGSPGRQGEFGMMGEPGERGETGFSGEPVRQDVFSEIA